MIDAIHQSSLNMALRCGEQFRRRYIEGERIPPGVAAGRGTGIHKANEINLKQKIASKKDMPLSDLQDAARDGYVNAFKNGVYIPKDKLPEKKKLLNIGLNDTIRCTNIYRVLVAESIRPISIEEPFNLDVGLALPLAGTMDYQEKPEVGDLKSTATKWPADRIDKEIQPVLYSYVHEKTQGVRPVFKYHVLIARRNKDGDPTSEEYQPLEKKPTDNDYKALFAKLQIFINMLKAGIFVPANPTSWWCGQSWCGYWYTCPYVGNSLPKKEI
ncbi:MAG: PD-(D/E)XK nuclease family protein [Pseudomonadota bacterium]